MFIMMMLNLIFSIMFIFMNHPLSFGCLLFFQSILVSLMSGLMYFNFWFSYILFLIMIGGMLVMFMYMTSVASNEKFKMPKFMISHTNLFMMIFFSLLFFLDKFYSNLNIINLMNLNQMEIFFDINLMKYYNYPNLMLMIFLMFYLLLTLIAVAKIVGKNFGTLRQK